MELASSRMLPSYAISNRGCAGSVGCDGYQKQLRHHDRKGHGDLSASFENC